MEEHADIQPAQEHAGGLTGGAGPWVVALMVSPGFMEGFEQASDVGGLQCGEWVGFVNGLASDSI